MVWSGSGLAEQRATLLAPISHALHIVALRAANPAPPSAGGHLPLWDRSAGARWHSRIATAAGTLLRVQHNGPGGLEVLVQHAGFVAVYSHLGLIAPGLDAGGSVTIKAGEQLGVVGRTGVSFGPHLYFGMLRDGQPVDPAPLLRVPLCGGSRSPSPATILGNSVSLPLSTGTTGDELPPTRRSSLLDDFPPIRGCSVETMIRVGTSRLNVDRGGSPFGRTGIARSTSQRSTTQRYKCRDPLGSIALRLPHMAFWGGSVVRLADGAGRDHRRGASPSAYGPRQAAYDLKKLRGKQIVRRIGSTRRYEPVPSGLRAITALLVLRDKAIKPLLAAALELTPTDGGQHPRAIDRHCQDLRLAMQGVFHELGIAA